MDLSQPNQAISTGMPSHVQGRMYGSAGTSTSGRSTTAVSTPSPVVQPLAQDLISRLYSQNVEIDALVRLQTERLRSGLEESRKRHCRALLSVLEPTVVERLREKEVQLENASLKNTELKEKVRQMSAESQVWSNVAKNNEAIVSSLRSTLEQVLLQNTVAAAPHAKEGHRDSDGIPFPADDAQSCCFAKAEERTKFAVDAEEEATAAVRRENEELRRRTVCRVCRERAVCVLLLPCRHLCLCEDCEPNLDVCPVCHSTKNTSLQIFRS